MIIAKIKEMSMKIRYVECPRCGKVVTELEALFAESFITCPICKSEIELINQ